VVAYLPIFRKVLALNIGDDINRHTQAAIDQIMVGEHPEGYSNNT
jgi:hypothetical protein